jgi:hypothetical protein
MVSPPLVRNTRNGTLRGYKVRRICPESQRPALVELRATFCSPACKLAAYRRRLRQGETRALSIM